ncbi:MAG TPA: FUSC family protein [Acidobacteriaceae bacterium]|nr:FUSC family protein [Acidobacteriaceae bacterium]
MTDTSSTAPATQSDRLSLQQGLRTAVAAALAYWITSLFHLPGGHWAAISAIVVMQSEVGATVMASRDRLAGTAIGACVGLLTALVWHHSIFVFALAILVVMMLCTALHYRNAGRLGGVTVAIIVLIPYPGPLWQIALQRFLEVSFGIVISLFVALAWNYVSNSVRRKHA